MASLPLSENSSLTGDIPLRTSSLADKGFADVEQLALAFTKVHGLLAGLGFIFNHVSQPPCTVKLQCALKVLNSYLAFELLL